MKKILVIICLFFLSGCTSNYNLEISNNSFKENLTVYINKSEIPVKIYDDIELDDQITPFMNNKYLAIPSKEDSYYHKVVTDEGDYYKVLMNYDYTEKEFGVSTSLKNCFENYEFGYDKKYYIHGYGNFYCLYSENLTISIKTNNKVLKNNADTVNGNVYTWNINKENEKNVDIEFEVEKGFPYRKIIHIAVIVFAIVVVLFALISILKKAKKVNEL